MVRFSNGTDELFMHVNAKAAFLCGVSFMGLQVLHAYGLIEINWLAIEKKAISLVDTTGDGKITSADLKHYWLRLVRVLTHQLPSSTGFTLGMYIGFKSA
jgi:uncharacterized membrane protein (Fun14 family)